MLQVERGRHDWPGAAPLDQVVDVGDQIVSLLEPFFQLADESSVLRAPALVAARGGVVHSRPCLASAVQIGRDLAQLLLDLCCDIGLRVAVLDGNAPAHMETHADTWRTWKPHVAAQANGNTLLHMEAARRCTRCVLQGQRFAISLNADGLQIPSLILHDLFEFLELIVFEGFASRPFVVLPGSFDVLPGGTVRMWHEAWRGTRHVACGAWHVARA
jgi:hypothetical protein